MEGLFAALLHKPAFRTVAKAAVKGGLGFVDAAKGAAVVAGRQWDQRVTGVVSRSKAAEEPTTAETAQTEAVVAPASAEATPVESSVKRQRRRPRKLTAVAGPAGDESAPVEASAAAKDTDQIASAARKRALSKIDGIGAGVAGVLAAAGVTTVEQLAAMDGAQLGEILSRAGPPYRSMDPSSWPDQARRLTGAEAPAAAAPLDGEPITSEEAPAAAAIVAQAEAEPTLVESALAGAPVTAIAPAAGQDADEITTTAGKADIIQIDGIGVGVAGVLAAAGVTTIEQVAAMDEAQLGEILSRAGSPYRSMDPSSWPEQARAMLESAR